MSQISDPVYLVVEDGGRFAAGLNMVNGKIRTTYMHVDDKRLYINLPEETDMVYYQDYNLTVEEVRSRVSQGRMHPRAIAIIVDLLL